VGYSKTKDLMKWQRTDRKRKLTTMKTINKGEIPTKGHLYRGHKTILWIRRTRTSETNDPTYWTIILEYKDGQYILQRLKQYNWRSKPSTHYWQLTKSLQFIRLKTLIIETVSFSIPKIPENSSRYINLSNQGHTYPCRAICFTTMLIITEPDILYIIFKSYSVTKDKNIYISQQQTLDIALDIRP